MSATTTESRLPLATAQHAAPDTAAWKRQQPHRREAAMRHMGIDSVDEIAARWKDDRLAGVAGVAR